ncbi:MAG: DUF2029 domain-containing protein [Alphaproteobacteria bacterium]|nr:DUF2029 domain-containing protein [Alphaproteobacteria bacterium]
MTRGRRAGTGPNHVRELLATIRDGRWLTRERLRLWGFAVLAASAIGLLYVVVSSDGLNDYQGRPLGTDYSNVYAAGTYVLEGNAAAPFDWPKQYAREQAIFGDKTPFYGWHYPPFFLFVAALLALIPYALSLAAWQGATLLLYLGMLQSILRAVPAAAGAWSNLVARDRLWLLLALAFPAVFVNVGHGHNGFLTAALLGGALVLLDSRPALAGVLFGLVAYKPQFGILIPLVLIASSRWRAFAAASVTVLALALATLIAFGPEVWRAFLASTALTRIEVLEQGGTGWHKIQSVFAMVRMWGGGVPLAYIVQGAVTVALAVALAWLWRSRAAYPLKAAALCIAAIAATPYSLDYDLVVLAPAIAFLAAHGFARGFAPWEKTALAALWLMPLIARTVAEQALLPLGVPAMLAVLLLILWRALAESGASSRLFASANAGSAHAN